MMAQQQTMGLVAAQIQSFLHSGIRMMQVASFTCQKKHPGVILQEGEGILDVI
jgi:hypothetical protein